MECTEIFFFPVSRFNKGVRFGRYDLRVHVTNSSQFVFGSNSEQLG